MNPAERALLRRWALGLLGTFCLIMGAQGPASAGECGEKAYLTLSADRVAIDLDLSPGTRAPAVASTVDTNRDGWISTAEGGAYTTTVLRGLLLVVDSMPRTLDVVGSEYPDPRLLTGGGTIKLHLAARITAAPSHRLVFDNRHSWGAHHTTVRPGPATVSLRVEQAGRLELAYFTGPVTPTPSLTRQVGAVLVTALGLGIAIESAGG